MHLYRRNIPKKIEKKQFRAKNIEVGDLVPNKLMMDFIINFLDKNQLGKDFIFDGLPRTIRQAEVIKHELFERG